MKNIIILFLILLGTSIFGKEIPKDIYYPILRNSKPAWYNPARQNYIQEIEGVYRIIRENGKIERDVYFLAEIQNIRIVSYDPNFENTEKFQFFNLKNK